MDQIRDKLTDLETYEALLLERDQLEKEADSIWIAYVQEFGELEAKLFERKIDSIRRKKAIAFAQQRINRGEAIDPEEMKLILKIPEARGYNPKSRLWFMLDYGYPERITGLMPRLTLAEMKAQARELLGSGE